MVAPAGPEWKPGVGRPTEDDSTLSESPTPQVSVVVPTRNRAPLVSRLLRQLVSMDDAAHYEIIVIDEASSDETPQVLSEFAMSHGVRIIRNDVPVGLSAARNLGTSAARGPFVAWIDDDDLTAPDRLARQHRALTTTGLRWSCAARVDIDDDLDVIGHVRCPSGEQLLERLLRINVLPSAGQGLLVDKALADAVGGYDESLPSAEDWDFCIRLAAVADPHMLDEPLVGYRTGVASMSTNTDRMESAIRTVIAKHSGLMRDAGVTPDWAAIHLSLLTADLLGSRRAASRRAIKALRCDVSPRNAARCCLVVAAPTWFARRSARNRREQVPTAWRLAAEQWLAAVRTA